MIPVGLHLKIKGFGQTGSRFAPRFTSLGSKQSLNPPRNAIARALSTVAPSQAPPKLPADDKNDTTVLETDVVVVGAGLGGLCCAALLASYGLEVLVVEAHNVPGGACHHWSRAGFHFDSGAALFSGITPNADGSVTANPLSSVLRAIGEDVEVVELQDSATCLVYPDGKQYRTQLGSAGFVDVVRDRWGEEAATQWSHFQHYIEGLQQSAGAVQPLAVRLDNSVALTAAFRRPLQFLSYLFGSMSSSGGSFGDVLDEQVTNRDVKALVELVTMGTCSVPPADINVDYMTRAFNEMWSPKTRLQYPKNGSQGIVDALLRGLRRHGGRLMLRSPVRRVLTASDGSPTCKGVLLESGRVIKARKAVVSNASVWDTARYVPRNAMLPDFVRYHENLEQNDSMLHLHIGFKAREGEDLPMHTYFLESEHSGDNGWPTIVIPSVPDPSLAPPGYHVLHATISEPYAPWVNLDRGGAEYAALKQKRSQILWDFVREIIPDIDERAVMSLVGTPRSHSRFLNRYKGAYGPRNLLTLNGLLPVAIKPLDNMYCCGDTVFPGVGTPAVAASGMWVANTIVPVASHWRKLDAVGV